MLKDHYFLNFLNLDLLTRRKTGGKVIQNKEQKSTFIFSKRESLAGGKRQKNKANHIWELTF